MWRLIAWALSRRPVARWLIARAARTPYFDLAGYMDRAWLVPYRAVIWRRLVRRYYDEEHFATDGTGPVSPWRRPFAWLLQRFDLAIRVHHILRADFARDPHDHPWNARTVILDGWYYERRDDGLHLRERGDTATLRFEEFHNVIAVSPSGVWTLFITGRKRGRWGFRTPDGAKVPYTEYPSFKLTR